MTIKKHDKQVLALIYCLLQDYEFWMGERNRTFRDPELDKQRLKSVAVAIMTES